MSLKDEVRPCSRCKGEGTIFRRGFSYGDKTYPDTTEACSACKGAKVFHGPDVDLIVEAITTTRGGNGKKRFRSAWNNKDRNRYSDVNAGRAYYVWRLARFHGGADVTMPMTADMVTRGDPFKAELDVIADHVAKVFFGTNMAGAARWAPLLGSNLTAEDFGDNLPATAYPCGPDKLD